MRNVSCKVTGEALANQKWTQGGKIAHLQMAGLPEHNDEKAPF